MTEHTAMTNVLTVPDERIRYELTSYKFGRAVGSFLTRWTDQDHNTSTFVLYRDNWTVARVPCARVTPKAIERAHADALDAAKRMAREKEAERRVLAREASR